MDPPSGLPGTRRLLSARRTVVCIGDSLTRGIVSASYVRLLERHLGRAGYRFVNAGVGGDTSREVLGRVARIVEHRPDIATLLIGTNDVLAGVGAPSGRTPETYRRDVDAILTRLQLDTAARIAVLEIPPLSERRSSDLNARVAEYNAALRSVAIGRGVAYLPVFDRLLSLLPAHGAADPHGARRGVVVRALLQHHVLRRSWDEISARRGRALLTDGVHLNDRAARAIAGLVADFLATTVQRDSS